MCNVGKKYFIKLSQEILLFVVKLAVILFFKLPFWMYIFCMLMNANETNDEYHIKLVGEDEL